MAKLCQIIAVVSGRKTDVQKQITELHHRVTKEALSQGLSRTYKPAFEDGEKKPDEKKLPQVSVSKALREAAQIWTSLLDVVATQDAANCHAKADVVVDNIKILADVPVTHLLFLEKQLADVKTFIEKSPTLDPAQEWKYDKNRGFYVTDPVDTIATQKVQEALTLAQATKEHPAQCQLISKDKTVGTWSSVFFSGAIPADEKKILLERVVKLQDAVKFAREHANQIDVVDRSVGKEIFDFILGPSKK